MRARRVALLDHSTGLATLSDYATRPIGGRVASLRRVSDALAARGHRVLVVSDCAPGWTDAGVEWVTKPPESVDVLVLNRGVGAGHAYIHAQHRVLWTHDLPHTGFAPDWRTLRALSAVVHMSRYARAVWQTMYPVLSEVPTVTIPNGVDLEVFRPGAKDRDLLVYISAPNRGLKRLPLILDALRSRVREDLRLEAYSHLRDLHPCEAPEAEDGFGEDYQAVEESSVDLRRPVPQVELAEVLGRAGLMVLPTAYPEICSNAVLQALACGVPIVTTGGVGATPEWVRDHRNGRLTRYHPADYMVHTVEMVRATEAIVSDPKVHAGYLARAASTRVLSWEEVGRSWVRLVESL